MYSFIHLENIFQVFHATEFTLVGRADFLMGRRTDMWLRNRELISFCCLAFDICHLVTVPLQPVEGVLRAPLYRGGKITEALRS